MLAAAPFIGFIPVRDLAKARVFYVAQLGLPLVAWFKDPDSNNLSLTDFGAA